MIRKPLPAFQGHGHVKFQGHAGPVDYTIHGDPSKLKFGTTRLRGSLSVPPEVAAEAFRAGSGVLTLEDGAEFRLQMLGHSAGAPEVFVELRV